MNFRIKLTLLISLTLLSLSFYNSTEVEAEQNNTAMNNANRCFGTRATLFVSVDNNLIRVLVNNRIISLNGIANLNNWPVTKRISLNIRPGDILRIRGRNSGIYSTSNPGGIIATLKFCSRGRIRTLNTNGSWRCDGRPARVEATNSGTSIWISGKGGPMDNISPQAQWIWFRVLSRQATTCSVRIPFI